LLQINLIGRKFLHNYTEYLWRC